MLWAPKGQAVDGSGWVISFYLFFGLENSTQIKFDKEEEYQRALDCLNEKFNVILDVWKYENGRAVKCELECFDVEIDNKGKIYCKETYYRTCEDVYKFNDLTVVDKNGDMRLVKSSKSKLMLTNDQLDVVERMKGIIDDMVRLKMIMYIDQDYNLCFLPGDKIEDLTMDETDGFVDTTGIVTSIKSKNVVEFYVENPFVKIKDE